MAEKWAARRRRWVVAGWLLLLAVVGGLGITLHGHESDLDQAMAAALRPMEAAIEPLSRGAV